MVGSRTHLDEKRLFPNSAGTAFLSLTRRSSGGRPVLTREICAPAALYNRQIQEQEIKRPNMQRTDTTNKNRARPVLQTTFDHRVTGFVLIALFAILAGCGKKQDPDGFAAGTTIEELKARSAQLAKQQADAVAAAEAAAGIKTELSRKAQEVGRGMSRKEVIALLGPPSSVITPGKLAAQGYDRQRDIEYVLTWDNPECSRVEVIFDVDDDATGWNRGQLCVAQVTETPLPAGYACTKAANTRYCK